MNLHFKVKWLYNKYAAEVRPYRGEIPEYPVLVTRSLTAVIHCYNTQLLAELDALEKPQNATVAFRNVNSIRTKSCLRLPNCHFADNYALFCLELQSHCITLKITNTLCASILMDSFVNVVYDSWRRGAVGRVSDLRSRGRGFESRPGMRRKNSGQVSHTYVPLFTKQYKLVPAKGR